MYKSEITKKNREAGEKNYNEIFVFYALNKYFPTYFGNIIIYANVYDYLKFCKPELPLELASNKIDEAELRYLENLKNDAIAAFSNGVKNRLRDMITNWSETKEKQKDLIEDYAKMICVENFIKLI